MKKTLLGSAALLLAACSSSSSTSPPGDDGGGSDATVDVATNDSGSPDTGILDTGAPDTASPDTGPGDSGSDAPTVCNSLTLHGQPVPVTLVATATPAPQGGSIVDGNYDLTASSIYTGPGGPSGPTGSTSQISLQIAGTTVQMVSAGSTQSTRTITIAANGTVLTSTDTCPDTRAQQVPYTTTTAAAVTTLTVYITATQSDGGTYMIGDVFTKQ